MSPRRGYVATVAIFAESLNPNLNPYPPAVTFNGSDSGSGSYIQWLGQHSYDLQLDVSKGVTSTIYNYTRKVKCLPLKQGGIWHGGEGGVTKRGRA
jgi:hypothetical protein